MKATHTATGTNWKNIDLNSDYEKSLNLLEPYTFDTLLLELYCNIREENLNIETVKAHALNELKLKYEEAKSILIDNLENITLKAKQERKDNL